MECFVDLELRLDPEVASHVLLSGLYGRLHRALVPDNKPGIAVAFPGYEEKPPSLGTRMRLLGSRKALETLVGADWLGGMRDHVKLGTVTEVPNHAIHRTLRRVQAKSSPERLRRRLMKRHGIDEKQAESRIPNSAAERLKHPWVQLASRSSGQTYRLFLCLGSEAPTQTSGVFNAFGLSPTATIPWF